MVNNMAMKKIVKYDHVCINTTYYAPNDNYVSHMGIVKKICGDGTIDIMICDTKQLVNVPKCAITYSNDHYHTHNMDMGVGYWQYTHNPFPPMVNISQPHYVNKHGKWSK